MLRCRRLWRCVIANFGNLYVGSENPVENLVAGPECETLTSVTIASMYLGLPGHGCNPASCETCKTCMGAQDVRNYLQNMYCTPIIHVQYQICGACSTSSASSSALGSVPAPRRLLPLCASSPSRPLPLAALHLRQRADHFRRNKLLQPLQQTAKVRTSRSPGARPSTAGRRCARHGHRMLRGCTANRNIYGL